MFRILDSQNSSCIANMTIYFPFVFIKYENMQTYVHTSQTNANILTKHRSRRRHSTSQKKAKELTKKRKVHTANRR